MIKKLTTEELELIHWIFERELKPPFRWGEKTDRQCYNLKGEPIGWLDSDNAFHLSRETFYHDINFKICEVFEPPYDGANWWYQIRPYLKSWLENLTNIEILVVL